MQEAGFRMRKWASNSEELVQVIKDHEISHKAPFDQNSLVQEENQSYMDYVVGGKHDINDETRAESAWPSVKSQNRQA